MHIMQINHIIRFLFKCVVFAAIALCCLFIGFVIVAYGGYAIVAYDLNRKQATDGGSRWRSGSQSALGAIAGRLEERRSKVGPLPLEFADYIRDEISRDTRLRDATSSMYTEVKPLSSSSRQDWCLVGRLFVRKCIRDLKDNDVIAIAAPWNEFVDAPIFYLTFDSTVRFLDADLYPPDEASAFFESIGGKHIWDDN
ncbi:MAG: hypothetical protein ACK5ZV_01970 [bacterium]